MVRVPLGLWGYEPISVNNSLYGFHRSVCTVRVILASDIVGFGVGFGSVLHVLGYSEANFPNVPPDGAMD